MVADATDLRGEKRVSGTREGAERARKDKSKRSSRVDPADLAGNLFHIGGTIFTMSEKAACVSKKVEKTGKLGCSLS